MTTNVVLQIKRLLMPGHPREDDSTSGICLFDLLMGIEVLQAPLLDLLLDMLIQLCHQQPKARAPVPRVRKTVHTSMQESAIPMADPHSRFGREDMECASSSTPISLEPLSLSHKSPPTAQGRFSPHYDFWFFNVTITSLYIKNMLHVSLSHWRDTECQRLFFWKYVSKNDFWSM